MSEHPFFEWIPPTANPWHVPIMDIAPFTQTHISTSLDPDCAENALSYTHDDGSRFFDALPQADREIPCSLLYHYTGHPADGPLYVPDAMEHKWAIFLLGHEIVCVRSWLAEVRVRASVTFSDGLMEVTSLRGACLHADEDPAWTVRCFDYLVRSYLLGIILPAPLPDDVGDEPGDCATWAFGVFGRRVILVAREPLPFDVPEEPIAIDRPVPPD